MKNSEAIRYAMKNIIHEGLTDIFTRPFEVDLLYSEKFYNKVRDELISVFNRIDQSKVIKDRDYGKLLEILKVHPIQHVLIPKKEAFDYRRCALIDPLDTLKYTALVLSISRDIEKARISKSKHIVYSYRLKFYKNGRIFDTNYTYTAFTKYTRLQVQKKRIKVLVECDISNYYDRLNLHRLESILQSLPIEKKRVKLINELLLFWAKRDSYGLPVGGNASRILAEAALIEVDNYLLSRNIKFARYVDDYRIFASNAKQAHYWMSLLIERLSMEGLLINQSKTKISDVSDKVPAPAEDTGEKDENTPRKRKDTPATIISGYSGKVPTKFRESTEKERDAIRNNSNQDIFNVIDKAIVIKPEEFREYCKTVLYRHEWNRFEQFIAVLEKFPQFSLYVVDMMIKNHEIIPESVRIKLRDNFANWLIEDDYIPEYMSIAFVSLLSSPGYRAANVLFSYFRSLKRNAGHYIGRATLEGLENIVSRGEVLEVRQYYDRADRWEKRQIIKMVDKKLTEAEKQAWFKNVRMNESDDLFTIGAIQNS